MPQTKKTIPSRKKVTKKAKPRKNTKITSRRLSRFKIVSIIAIILFAAVGTYLTFHSSANTVNFVRVGVHPQAAAQPTSYGKTIAALEGWNGKLYSGYGDWGINSAVNTGPITINPLDVSTNSFGSSALVSALPSCSTALSSTEVCNHAAHSTHSWRKINGGLYAPSAQSAGADYIVGTIDSAGKPVWKNSQAGGFTHAFDVASLTGSDLWIVGQTGPNAIARRSLDGGTSWQDMRSVPTSNGSSTARFFGAGVYKGKLYLQAINNDAGSSIAEKQSKVFDPATNTWSDGPSIGVFNHAEEFAGKMVYVRSFASGIWSGLFQAFDGTAVTTPGSLYVYNYTIDRSSNTLYVVTTAGEIKKTTDLITWTSVGTVRYGTSITMLNGTLYVGGSDSAIYKQEVGSPVVTTPPPITPTPADTIAPTISINQPASGSNVGSRVNVQAAGSDNVQVTKIELFIDGVLVKSVAGNSIKYGWKVGNFGNHTIVVKAYDAAANVGQASSTVTR